MGVEFFRVDINIPNESDGSFSLKIASTTGKIVTPLDMFRAAFATLDQLVDQFVVPGSKLTSFDILAEARAKGHEYTGPHVLKDKPQ